MHRIREETPAERQAEIEDIRTAVRDEPEALYVETAYERLRIFSRLGLRHLFYPEGSKESESAKWN